MKHVRRDAAEQNTVRLIGGRWRGRKIHFTDGEGLRPTPSRVRETLFNWLMHEVRDARVLDLYAGSGALAFEALSRGAAGAVLVEHAREAVSAIRQNARSLEAEKLIEVLPMKVDRALAKVGRVGGLFAIVFLDPPYADVAAPAFAQVLSAAAGLVAPAGALVLEHASSDAAPAAPLLDFDRSRRYGDTTLSLYRAPIRPSGECAV